MQSSNASTKHSAKMFLTPMCFSQLSMRKRQQTNGYTNTIMKGLISHLTTKHQALMWHRFFEAYSPESIKKVELKPCLILSDEFIPGELFLSRARLRFNSPMQNSNEKTIFTTCQKRQPFTRGWNSFQEFHQRQFSGQVG